MKKFLRKLFKIHSPSEDFNPDSLHMTVSDLQRILSKLPKDIPVIVAVTSEDDCNDVKGFRYVRTAGILFSEYERDGEQRVLCLNSAQHGVDISTQVKSRDCVCEKVLF